MLQEHRQENRTDSLYGEESDHSALGEAPPAAQDYFSSVVQSMSDSLVVIGADGCIASVNRATLDLLGYAEAELIGQRPGILFADGTVRGTGLETLHERGIIQRGEKILRAKDNRQIPVFYSGSVLRGPTGHVDGVVCVMHDATKQKKLENRLRDALRKQQELVQLKSQFVATVSHEFRTPLAIIQANSEMMHRFQDRMDTQQETLCFDQVQKQIKHMISLLEGALTLEKMQTGSMDFQPVPVDLDRLCSELIEAAQGRVRRSFSYHFQGEHRKVKVDQRLIKQALTNLLSNAIKFSKPGSEIRVTLTLSDEVSLEVRDQGIGIPEADQANVFDPFFRASNVSTISGTGLGLAMAQMAVELHDGTILIKSQPGEGTVVTIHLPFSPAKAAGEWFG